MSSELIKPSVMINSLISFLAICAVQWGMKRNLETESSILQVIPPDTPNPSTMSSTPDTIPRPRSRLARMKPNRAQCWLLGQQAAMLFCGIVLPRYGTRLLLDLVWGAFEIALLTFVYQRTLDVIFPRPEMLRYRHPKDPGGKMFVLEITKVDPLRLLQKDSARRALGVLAAFLTLFALATGHRIVLAVVSAAWTLSATSALVGPTMSVRVMVMGLIGLHVVVITLDIVGRTVIESYYPTNPNAPRKPGNLAQISPWLGDLMTIFAWVLSTTMPAGIIDLTNRFEHLSHVTLTGILSGPGEPVFIERGKPLFGTRSLTNIGMTSFATSLAILTFLNERYKDNKEITGYIAMGSVLTVPITVSGIVIGALCQGRLRDWWGYYEEWAPREVGSDRAEGVNTAVIPNGVAEEEDELNFGV